MIIFGRPLLETPLPNTSRVRWVFIALVVVGAALRAFACFAAVGQVHPDEHQQFIEQTNRIVYGCSVLYWEQVRGVRHPLYPALFAVPLASFEAVGLSDTLVQGALLRWTVSVLALLACALFAWELQRRGDTIAAIGSMLAFSVLSDTIYAHVHPISEIGATVPTLLALIWMERRPFWAGTMLGLSFGIRFQMGFLIAAIFAMAWVQQRFRIDKPLLRLGLGLALVLFGLGLSDRIIFDGWFHSPIEYYRANITDGIANSWGVHPWYQYFLWLGEAGWAIVALPALVILIGAWREWRLAVLAIGFAVPHLLVGHKESRFLLPLAPIMAALGATGFSEMCRLLQGWKRSAALIVATAVLVLVSVVRVPVLEWNTEPFRSQAYLLHAAGQREDLTGIVTFCCNRADSGNYFYLRRNVPLLDVEYPDLETLQQLSSETGPRLNFMICPTKRIEEFARFRPVPIAVSGAWTLYRLESPASKPQ